MYNFLRENVADIEQCLLKLIPGYANFLET